jgi:hypothetical protein
MCQVRARETNIGEPPFQRREVLNDVKTGESSAPWDKSCECLIIEQGGVRRTGGVNLARAPVRNVRPCEIDVKGNIRVVETYEDKSTKAVHRFGVVHSSDEGWETSSSEGAASSSVIYASTTQVGGACG